MHLVFVSARLFVCALSNFHPCSWFLHGILQSGRPTFNLVFIAVSKIGFIEPSSLLG